jgi:hypothetical protein
MSRVILLTKGLAAIVDDEGYADLSQYRWYAGGNGYARRDKRDHEPGVRSILMHRAIMLPGPGFVVDHINGDGLDNRRSNLRVCTFAENMANQSRHRDSVSRFKGVCWCKRDSRWKALICGQHLGRFDTEEEAARAYDRAALERFGEFARLNFGKDFAEALANAAGQV